MKYAELVRDYELDLEIVEPQKLAAGRLLREISTDQFDYKLKLVRGNASFTFPFMMGCGHAVSVRNRSYGPQREAWPTPDIENVLECLALDAQSFEYADDVDEFAAEFGYEQPSKAIETYNACRDTRDQLERLLGRDGVLELYECDDFEHKYMTEEQIADGWTNIREMIVSTYGADDVDALTQGFNDWTDGLCKDGRISDWQYHNVTMPE